MKEIPVPYVRANQWGIVLFVAASAVLGQPWLIAVLWLVQIVGLLIGAQGNLFIIIAKPFLQKKAAGAQTEAAELQRFNNSIAVTLLTLSLVSFALGWQTAGYVLAILVALAAFIAICGFCVGCFLYFQLKQWRRKLGS